MKLQQQLSTLEQGKILKTLGVQASLYSWVYDTLNGMWDISGMPVEAHYLINKERECYPAFTVAELGVMLPVMLELACGGLTAIVSHRVNPNWATGDNAIHSNKWMCYNIENESFSYYYTTEAEARAFMLIYLLENNHTTPEEVNQRLNSN